MVKNSFANRAINKSRTSKKSLKKYKDEYQLQYISGSKSLEENKTLEDKLNLIKNNFDKADKKYSKYSSIKYNLNNGKLFKGEVTRYQKELKEVKSEMFDIFNTTWNELVKYRLDIPSETFKIYRNKYGVYNFDVTRNTFNVTIFDEDY